MCGGNLSSSSLSLRLESGAWENLDLQSPLQTFWRVEFMRFNNVRQWLIRPRSGRPPMSIDDSARTDNAFQDNPRKFLRVSSAKLSIFNFQQFEMFHRKIEMFPYKMNFLRKPIFEEYFLRLDHAQRLVMNWAMILDTGTELISMMNASFIP